MQYNLGVQHDILKNALPSFQTLHYPYPTLVPEVYALTVSITNVATLQEKRAYRYKGNVYPQVLIVFKASADKLSKY